MENLEKVCNDPEPWEKLMAKLLVYKQLLRDDSPSEKTLRAARAELEKPIYLSLDLYTIDEAEDTLEGLTEKMLEHIDRRSKCAGAAMTRALAKVKSDGSDSRS